MTRCGGRRGRDEGGVTNFRTSQPDLERDVGRVGAKTGRNCESLTLKPTRQCHRLDSGHGQKHSCHLFDLLLTHHLELTPSHFETDQFLGEGRSNGHLRSL